MSIPDYISEKVTDPAVLKKLKTTAQKKSYIEKAPRLSHTVPPVATQVLEMRIEQDQTRDLRCVRT